MKFVMTGHKGLIGSSLLKRLEERGDEAVLLVDERDGKTLNDLDDIELSEPVDMMIHLASFCKINKCVGGPDLAFENNVLGMHKVMEFCRRHKIPKIVFTSSSRVLSPEKNTYTASKLYGEELVKGYSQSYGVDYVIIRPSTVYGPFDDKTSRLMDIWCRAALRGEELKIFGSSGRTLDFTYIDDFVDGMLLAMAQKNEAFDISAGEGIPLDYVADLLVFLAGRGSKNFYPAEITQPQEVELDISAIRSLGYKPKVGIDEGVKRTLDWYRENLDKLGR